MDRLGELRALYQEKNLPQARELYEREPGHTDPEWYWLGSLVYWHLGEYPLSRWAADYGLALKPQGEMRVKLLQRLGTTEERLGAYGEAVEHLEACLRELPAYPSLGAVLKGPVLNNMAHAYYNRNGKPDSLERAIILYQRAADQFRQERMQEHLCACLHSLAWVLCDTGQADQAAQVIDESAPLATGESPRLRQVVANAYQLLVAGDCARSLETLEPVLRREDNGPAYVYALSVMAMASLALRHESPGALRDAQTLVRQAIYASLLPSADPACWSVANRLQKRVIAALQQQDRGA